MVVFTSWFLNLVITAAATGILLIEGLTSLIDIIDGADDLADLLVVGVLALNFVLEVLLESLVLDLNAIDSTGQDGHLLLLIVELCSHISQGLSLCQVPSLHHSTSAGHLPIAEILDSSKLVLFDGPLIRPFHSAE